MSKKLYSKENLRIAKNIKNARISRGLSQFEVGKNIDKTQSFISKIEQGQLIISALDLKILCDLYGISVEDVLNK